MTRERTRAGKPRARAAGKSSDVLTPLIPERERIMPSAYIRARAWFVAQQMGVDPTVRK